MTQREQTGKLHVAVCLICEIYILNFLAKECATDGCLLCDTKRKKGTKGFWKFCSHTGLCFEVPCRLWLQWAIISSFLEKTSSLRLLPYWSESFHLLQALRVPASRDLYFIVAGKHTAGQWWLIFLPSRLPVWTTWSLSRQELLAGSAARELH